MVHGGMDAGRAGTGERISWRSASTAFLVSVATVLGTGILGLPTSLWKSGIWPFATLFLVTTFAQLAVVRFASILLCASQTQLENAAREDPAPSLNGGFLLSDQSAVAPPCSPSLHSLSEFFLKSKYARALFELSAMLHFISILIAYAIGAPQAYALLLGVNVSVPLKRAASAIFVGLSALLICTVLRRRGAGVLAAATAMKGTLLTLLVAAVAIVAVQDRRQIKDDWSAWANPFLLGTVAVGGVINVMPVTYSWCFPKTPTYQELRGYCNAVSGAVIACSVLNLIWSVSVLSVVPQTSGKSDHLVSSLQSAYENGAISTDPLVATLNVEQRTVSSAVRAMTNVFTALAVTISFVVMGTGMRHMIDGQTESFAKQPSSADADRLRWLFYLIWFGVIVVVAMLKPSGFMDTMERFTSLALNLEGGIFICAMFWNLRRSSSYMSSPYAETNVSSALLLCFTVLFYAFAVGFTILFDINALFRGTR